MPRAGATQEAEKRLALLKAARVPSPGRPAHRVAQGLVAKAFCAAFQRDRARLQVVARDGQIDSRLEMADVTRPEAGRLIGSYGTGRKPGMLILSSLAGNVSVGLVSE